VGDSVGALAITATPLFQTSFLPDFTPVNFLFWEMVVWPIFWHCFPAIVEAALAAFTLRPRAKHITRDERIHFTFESTNAVV
jgi:hypothetical protein